jgi:hypothetical protein
MGHARLGSLIKSILVGRGGGRGRQEDLADVEGCD